MNYEQLFELATKRAFVRWVRSGTIERLTVNNNGGKYQGQIIALSLLRIRENGAPAAHFIYRDNIDGVEKSNFDVEEVTSISITTANRLIQVARSFALYAAYVQHEADNARITPQDHVSTMLQTVVNC